MKTNAFLLLLSFFACMIANAQTGNYDECLSVGHGLYKVKTHDRWGIIDKDGNLKLSIEYNEPLFMNGCAVITNFKTRQLAGIIDTLGRFKQYPPYFINASFPFVCDDMLAIREIETGNWGFINIRTGELLKVKIQGFKNKNKILDRLGLSGKGIKGTFVFEFAAPFVEGMATVYSSKTGWHHIDKYGQERFKDSNLRPALFRSSIHNGECVIFNDNGIVVCKETSDHYAGIINYLESEYETKDYHNGLRPPYVITTNNSRLILNSKFQADKFENLSRGDSVILIERPKVIPNVVEKKDSFNLARDIKIELSRKSIAAGAKGTASIIINVTNSGKFQSDTLRLVINVKGVKKEWCGTLTQGATQQITISVPAKFASAAITREATWILQNTNDKITGEDTVTIRRYKPSRR